MNSLYLWIIIGILSIGLTIFLVISFVLNHKQKKYRAEQTVKEILLRAVKRKEKIEKINLIDGKAEIFSIEDIFCEMLDWVYLLQELNDKEFFYLKKVCNAIKEKFVLNYLDKEEYQKVYKDIAIQLDMTVPYYKICKDGCRVVRYNDTGKDVYRESAKDLVDKGLIFSEKWDKLKEAFYIKFYKIYDN